MIQVTNSFFPPIENYMKQIEKIWESKVLTNRGKLTLELEDNLKNYLQVDNIILMNNGTIPIQIALKILGIGTEVITTPFSYVATTSSIIWEKLNPIFVDIDPEYLTIDENKIEAVITKRTKCILATHVFGNPCNVLELNRLANKYGLFLIYDAAHAFGVKYNGMSIFNYGDISTCSFHATKLYHTGEGGALFCNNEKFREKSFYSHNFGHNGPTEFHGLGINGKISELQSAMGLSVFPYLKDIILGREKVVSFYKNNLSFCNYRTMKLREGTEWNYSYFPIIFASEEILLRVQAKLNKNEIFPRRYFHPSLNKLKYVNGNEALIAESISSRILCLPLSHYIDEEFLYLICKIIDENI